jgi:transcriptional regulator with PAS, ATPase and Fis domain
MDVEGLDEEQLLALAARIDTRLSALKPLPETGTRHNYDAIIGRSRPMLDLYRMLDRVIDSDSTVLVQGENGTGKELIAKAIHHNSIRAERRFVIQNCSAFNDNLLDSELFGHKKGAFTGAIADKQGLFEVADGGTFFLDEIGDMSPALQVKLLRVLQEGTFMPVGDTAIRKVDVRIIAATNRDLKRMVERGEFREDLFYRINVINLVLPPLRERKDDIAMLIDAFLRKHGRGRRAGKRLSRGCFERMVAYNWPGNVRELENEVERLVVLAGEEKVIEETMLSPRIRPHGASGSAADDGVGLPGAVATLERHMIGEALRRHRGNKTRAAAELKISRRNLIRLVAKYQLGSKGKTS